jgi:predicted acetyltransferase
VSVEVRTCSPEEFGQALGPIWHYFGRGVSERDVARMTRILPPERMYGAWADGSVVGGAGAYPLHLTVPGGAVVPTAGIVAVGVIPTHRRRGILTELMRRQLEELHERGEEPLALLYASEGAIYRRYGYGIASLCGEIQIEREQAGFRDGGVAAAAARLVSKEEALDLFPQIYERVRAETPGMFARSPDWWDVRRLSARPFRPGGEQVYTVLELDGRPEAYAIHRLDVAFERGMSASTLEITEAIGATPEATAEIWRYLFSTDWYRVATCDFLPLDHPLFFLLAEPRRMRFTVGEALWARPIDVGGALSARGYADGAAVVLEVRDEFCPWNTGRWKLEDGEAQRTDAAAELALDVAELGAVYLGGFTFAQLARAGKVEELREGALERADAVFRTTRQPWCPELF